MNQSRSRSKARAIAITKSDEAEVKKALVFRTTLLCLCALAALTALPLLWSL